MDIHTGSLDLLLVILGFMIGQVTKWKTPIAVAILVVRMAKWYIDTHPHGKKIAKDTDIDEKLQKIVIEDNEPLG